jgi:hypothetical protein
MPEPEKKNGSRGSPTNFHKNGQLLQKMQQLDYGEFRLNMLRGKKMQKMLIALGHHPG